MALHEPKQVAHSMQQDAAVDIIYIDSESARGPWSTKQIGMGINLQRMQLEGRSYFAREAGARGENLRLVDTSGIDNETGGGSKTPRVDQGRRKKRVKKEKQANALHDRISMEGVLSQRTQNGHAEAATYQLHNSSSLLHPNPVPSQEDTTLMEHNEYGTQSQQNDYGSLPDRCSLMSAYVQLPATSPTTDRQSDESIYDVSDRERERMKSWCRRKKNKRKAEED